MNFDKYQEEKISSVKCHHPPGGNSNFSLNWENTTTPLTPTKKQFKQVSNIKFNEQENQFNSQNLNQIENKGKKCPTTPKGKLNLFGNYDHSEKVNSIKISNAPGGNSNFFFGTDNTSYNEYKRK